MVVYKCQSCRAVLESAEQCQGTIDQCPICNHPNLVPSRGTAIRSGKMVLFGCLAVGLISISALLMNILRNPSGTAQTGPSQHLELITPITPTPPTDARAATMAVANPLQKVEDVHPTPTSQLATPASAEATKAKKIAALKARINEKIGSGIMIAALNQPRPQNDSRIAGIDDGVARGLGVAIVFRPMFVIPTAAELQKPGSGEDAMAFFRQFLSHTDEAQTALNRHDMEDFVGRVALLMALAAALDVDTDDEAQLFESSSLSWSDKAMLLARFREWRRKGAQEARDAGDHLIEMGANQLAP